MRHHILVKWKDDAGDRAALANEVRAMFASLTAMEGIHSVRVHPNVVDRPNRYDLMIVLCMDEKALPLYDASAAHQAWKAQYGEKIAAKVIFDCE